jgi:hypothetical protein
MVTDMKLISWNYLKSLQTLAKHRHLNDDYFLSCTQHTDSYLTGGLCHVHAQSCKNNALAS